MSLPELATKAPSTPALMSKTVRTTTSSAGRPIASSLRSCGITKYRHSSGGSTMVLTWRVGMGSAWSIQKVWVMISSASARAWWSWYIMWKQ